MALQVMNPRTASRSLQPVRIDTRHIRPVGVGLTRAFDEKALVYISVSRELAAKNRGSKRSTRRAAVDDELDRVDIRRIVRGEEEHSFSELFRLTPTAQRNRG